MFLVARIDIYSVNKRGSIIGHMCPHNLNLRTSTYIFRGELIKNTYSSGGVGGGEVTVNAFTSTRHLWGLDFKSTS